ncbi:MAG: hypothetical protein RPU52_06270 [Candidatus Sedimenticola sp. (ex Thyasira tokunagai)]
MKISFKELHHHLMLDPYYGLESPATEAIINRAYRDNAESALYQQFSNRFYLVPCKTDKQRHLIYLWCGLMGLPAYREDSPLGWQREEFLEHWTEDFDLKLDEIRKFLRKYKWPLPTCIFPDDADNTERRVALGKAEYDAAFHDFTVELPILEDELAGIKKNHPKSIEELQQKKDLIDEINRQITAIKCGDAIYGKETPIEKELRIEAMIEEETIKRGKHGAQSRVSKRIDLSPQRVSQIHKRHKKRNK